MSSSIKQTDIKFNKNIYISSQLRNNSTAHILADYVEQALPVFRKHLNFSDYVVIRIAQIKQVGTTGTFSPLLPLITIEPQKDVLQFFQTLAHELVHAEQYFEGRMKIVFERIRWVKLWKGSVVRASYRNRPWEVEAFSRQVEIGTKVFNEVFPQHAKF